MSLKAIFILHTAGQPLRQKQREEGQHDQDQTRPDGGVNIAFNHIVDEEWHGLGAALQAARKENRRAKFAQRPRPTQDQSGGEGAK